MTDPQPVISKAKTYEKKKQFLTLLHLAYTPALLWLSVALPLSVSMASWASAWDMNAYVTVGIYFLFFSVYIMAVDFPFSFYSGYRLEHQFDLSNQTAGAWLKEFIKRTLLSFGLSLALIEGLYALIWTYPGHWWLLAWAAFALVSYGIGKIFPVWIVPLFYKYGKVEDEGLKKRIFDLAARYGMPVENVYSLNLSKTTKKANAAFMGMGKTKRVVLSDTLLEHFTADEIETVVAHELGHFKHRDVIKQLCFGLALSLVGFWIAFHLMGPVSAVFGLQGAEDPAALPVLFLIFYVFNLILTPLQNGFSRCLERAADRFALDAFPRPEVFVSCMDKLGKVNLADPSPNVLYEWFFYDHPAISKRIRMAQAPRKG